MKWNSKSTKHFTIMCILFAFGTIYLIFDYCSLPNETNLMWEGEFKNDVDIAFGEPDKSLKIGLGDGFISNIEMIFIHLSLFFGGLQTYDFLMTFESKKEIDVKAYFRKIIYRKKNNIDKED